MSAGAQVLEEVVVTAQKKAESLTEAPVAVTLVSAQEITDLSVFQADELCLPCEGGPTCLTRPLVRFNA